MHGGEAGDVRPDWSHQQFACADRRVIAVQGILRISDAQEKVLCHGVSPLKPIVEGDQGAAVDQNPLTIAQRGVESGKPHPPSLLAPTATFLLEVAECLLMRPEY